MTKIIQQTSANTCVACVLAMMVNESEQYVLDWFEHNDPPFSDLDAFIFLAHHGIFLSLQIDCKEDEDSINLDEIDYFKVHVGIDKRILYLIVDSPTNDNGTHAVFWNGTAVLDPLQDTPQPLENYKVQCIYPMIVTKERYDNTILKELL